jgi:hypothetical protein
MNNKQLYIYLLRFDYMYKKVYSTFPIYMREKEHANGIFFLCDCVWVPAVPVCLCMWCL